MTKMTREAFLAATGKLSPAVRDKLNRRDLEIRRQIEIKLSSGEGEI